PRRTDARNSFSLDPAIQTCNPEGVGSPSGLSEAGAAHADKHFIRLGKAFHRSRQIGVGPAHAGNHRTDAGKNLLEINTIQATHRSFGFAEVENAAFAPGLENAHDLAEAGIVVGEIAEAEG